MNHEQFTQSGEPVIVTEYSDTVLQIEEAPTCEYCGEPGKLTEISDCDPSVGYHSRLLICRDCFREHKAASRFACGSCR